MIHSYSRPQAIGRLDRRRAKEVNDGSHRKLPLLAGLWLDQNLQL
jgi:hypothetical protein